MRDFEDIYAIAVDRKGGPAALDELLLTPLTPVQLTATDDDRWLAAMAKCLFQAGFNWKVIDAKWPDMETAFDGFSTAKVAAYHNGDIDRLLSDKRIVRNGAKIMAVIENARFVHKIAGDHDGFGKFIASWPAETHNELLDFIAKQGARLGSVTGQRMLRQMGRDGYILSPDVIARLKAEGILEKPPASKRDLAAIQEAFNGWMAQSGRCLTQISQILAYSV